MQPPGPQRLPIIGNLLAFGANPIEFFQRCAAEYGDVVRLQVGRWPALLLNHPEHLETVLLTNNRNFMKHRFFFRHVTEIFGKGLLTNEGSPWLRQRRLMQPAFHRERIAGYAATMTEATGKMLARWPSRTETRDVHEDFMALTMEIATKTLFGAELAPAVTEEISDAVSDAITEIAHRFRRPARVPNWLPVPSNRRYYAALRKVDRLMYAFIDEKERNGSGDDLLSMLLDVRDEDGSRMDRQQVRDEAITIFLAGHETTAIALSWTMYLLAQSPDVQEKAAGASQEYLLHVIHEAMRLYPPAYAIGREAIEDCEIGGYPVPAGTTLFMAPIVVHRDARFFEDPLTFRPERWENDLARTLPRFAYVPFGGGPRVCIGNNFALMETAIVLRALLQRYRFAATRTVAPFASITLRPDGGMPLKVSPR